MISIELDGGVFNLRAAGILIRDDKVLVQRGINDDFFFLPGGRVEMFEDSKETVIREYKEETSADIKITRLLWINESFFEFKGTPFHELCFYYLVELSGASQMPSDEVFQSDELDGTRFEYSWVKLENIQKINLVPNFLKTKMLDLPTQTEHLVSKQ